MTRNEIFGVFVGSGEYTTLDALAKRRAEEGWLIVDDFGEEFYRQFKASHDRNVVVNGSSAGECVAKVVKLAIDNGASQVLVPLNEVLQGFTNDLNSEDQMRRNAVQLAWSLRSGGYLENNRLLVVPTEIWDAVANEVREYGNHVC